MCTPSTPTGITTRLCSTCPHYCHSAKPTRSRYKNLSLSLSLSLSYVNLNILSIHQIERKRHLGNDAVLIIFQDGRTPFSPECITSKYNRTHSLSLPPQTHARSLSLSHLKKSMWLCKSSRIPPRELRCTRWRWPAERECPSMGLASPTLLCSPWIMCSVTSSSRKVHHSTLLTTTQHSQLDLHLSVINGLKSSMRSPGFAKKIARSRSFLLERFVEKYLPKV